jgi:uncharacterized integral membrane protein
MIRFLKALVLLPIAIIVILLAVANRGPVLLSLDPFSQEIPEIAFKVPLYAVIFASVMVGVVIGGIAAWLAQRPNRQERRRYRREASHLRREAERVRTESTRRRENQEARNLPALPSAAPQV